MALASPWRYTNVVTAPRPNRTTESLYDDTFAALEESIEAIIGDDVEARCAAVWAATEAVTTLYLNLDITQCGEMVESLADQYGRVLSRLVDINLTNDPAIAQEIIELLENLRESWVAPYGTVPASHSKSRPAKPGVPSTTETTVADQRLAEARSPR